MKTQKIPTPEQSSTRSKTILVVEDDEIIRGMVVEILRLKKFLTLEAKDGKEGVEIALKKHPDLILLDLIMPEMDGMTALGVIRADTWGKTVPVIILTNLSADTEQLAEDMVTHKPIYYLIKSDWKIHDIVEKVEELLGMQEPA